MGRATNEAGEPLSPLPAEKDGERGNEIFGAVTQGGTRSSLALGYFHIIPAGFRFGSLRSRGDGDEGWMFQAN